MFAITIVAGEKRAYWKKNTQESREPTINFRCFILPETSVHVRAVAKAIAKLATQAAQSETTNEKPRARNPWKDSITVILPS